jgi:hypothetical protein
MRSSGIDIADAFSADPYTGNGGTQTITNGVDMSGEGGLTWIKSRSAATDHQLFDTERGAIKELISNSTAAEATDADTLTAFNSDGFSLGADSNVNTSAATYVAWTFRKAPKFLDVVKYTGDGVAGRTVAHGLSAAVGSIIIKRTDTTSNWAVYHRANTAAPETDYLSLNLANATADDATYWNDTAPNDSVFTVGTNAAVNASGGTYVAYLFAHDTTASSVIQCGSYTGNGSATGPVITLGWEPQWLLTKQVTSSNLWLIYDNQRSPTNPRDDLILPSSSDAEITNSSANAIDFTATGFQLKGGGFNINQSGETYIYMAIRKEGA